MSKTVLINVRTFAAGVDVTGVSNKIELSSEVEVKKTTNHGSGGWDEAPICYSRAHRSTGD